MAGGIVTANGSFATAPGSATLAFIPSHGQSYQIDARITGMTGDGNWVAFGFSNNQSTGKMSRSGKIGQVAQTK